MWSFRAVVADFSTLIQVEWSVCVGGHLMTGVYVFWYCWLRRCGHSVAAGSQVEC